jgi:hypothetical protein
MPGHSLQSPEFIPLHLSKKEIKKPITVVNDFFSFADLPQVRTIMWEWLKITVTGSYSKSLSRDERSDLLYFYEQLQKLIEAAHLLHAQGQTTTP